MKAALNALHGHLQMPNQCLMGVNKDLDVAFKDKGAVCGIQSIAMIQSRGEPENGRYAFPTLPLSAVNHI